MNPILFSVILISVVACSSNPISPESKPTREPASGPSSAIPFGAKLPEGLYQGPFNINVDGSTRVAAKTYLPIQHDQSKTWPLVVLLHGFSGTAEGEDLYLGLRFRTSIRGFILLTPEGTRTPEGIRSPKGPRNAEDKDISGLQFWNATDSCCDFGGTKVDDTAYLLALIEKTVKKYNVDPNRIYLFGHSNGGFMANQLGCEAGKTFAGIASLAGGTYKDLKSCRVPDAVRYLQIHAVDDPTISYADAPEYAGGQATVSQWISKNGCSGKPTKGPARDFLFLIPGLDTTSQSWKNCRSGKNVELWTIKAHEAEKHNSHVPFFNFLPLPGVTVLFTDAVLDFLFAR